MSRLDELIAELSPDGVEFIEFKRIIAIGYTDVDKKSIQMKSLQNIIRLEINYYATKL